MGQIDLLKNYSYSQEQSAKKFLKTIIQKLYEPTMNVFP